MGKLCPNCHKEQMIAKGGGCKYECPLCGYSCYEAPPRVHVSSGATSAMQSATDELNAAHAEFQRSAAKWDEIDRQMKAQRRWEKEQRKAQKKQAKKGITLGKIIAVIIVLWFLSQFFS